MGVFNSIKDLGLVYTKEVESTNTPATFHQLEYVLTDAEVPSSEIYTSAFTNTPGFSGQPVKQMGLQLVKKDVVYVDELIDTFPDGPQILDHLQKKIILKMKELGEAHMEAMPDLQRLNYVISADEQAPYRKIMSKCLSASSSIAVNARRGPANFVIARYEIVKMLMFGFSPIDFVYKIAGNDGLGIGNIAGLTMYVCDDLGDTVLVGRMPTSDSEPGLKFISNEEGLTKNVVFDEKGLDVVGTNIRYSLNAYSDEDKYYYLAFKCNTDALYNKN